MVSSAIVGAAKAQVADIDVRNQVFVEPSPSSEMTVISPAARVAISPTEWLAINGGYSADIVSGATEPLKAGPQFADSPDIISTASITELRHVASGGVTFRRPHTRLGATYTHGTESDYRSNALTVSAATDFLQRNTEIEIAYSRGFDQVCDRSINANLESTNRVALDESSGCFTSIEDRRELDISLDNFHGAWTQTWTPLFATQVVFTGAIQSGFLANPYRSVVIGPSGESAQENHPGHRTRTAVAVRGKYYLRPLETALGFGIRGYRDTWDILSQAYEFDAERNLVEWLRIRIHARYYRQTGAIFWSDDYTGGEPITGARGRYFSGDRELSPLKNFIAGGNVTGSWHGAPGQRLLGFMLDLEAIGGVDVMRTYLDDFTWAGRQPNDTFAVIANVGLRTAF